MKKKFVVSIFCMAVAVMWVGLSASVASAKVYTSSEYKSLYDYSKTIAYKNLAGDRVTQERTGYRYQHDLDDPIIRCGVEEGTCAMPATDSQYLRVNTELKRFKVYLPPGTTSTNLTLYMDGDARYVAVARLGQPPTGDYASYLTDLSDSDYLKLTTLGFKGSELKAGDCIGRNISGIHRIAVGSINVSSPADGGWLYVLMLWKSGAVLGNVFSNSINTGPFISWFRSVDWTTFGGGGSIITPTPTPTPTPAPTPNPTPDIKANGQNGEIFISSGTPVSITAGLAQGDQNGELADWWIAYSSPWGWYSLDSNGWTPGINLLAMYPLISIPEVEIINEYLPVGNFIFYFGVDMSPNNVLDSPLYYDYVQVHVVN